MRACPHCGSVRLKTIDVRGATCSVRRRRCLSCKATFRTAEMTFDALTPEQRHDAEDSYREHLRETRRLQALSRQKRLTICQTSDEK